jgi:hypothetical protein
MTTSGLRLRTLTTASRPSAASPQTSHSGWLRKRAQRPRRTTSWSSATRIRKGTDHLPNQVASKNGACFGCTIKINGLPYSSDRNSELNTPALQANELFQHRGHVPKCMYQITQGIQVVTSDGEAFGMIFSTHHGRVARPE